MEECKQHINFLELLAALLALRLFVRNQEGISILLLLDSVTAIAFINRMGGHPLHAPIGSCSGDLELVHLQEHNSSCGTSPGVGECKGRLGITPSN